MKNTAFFNSVQIGSYVSTDKNSGVLKTYFTYANGESIEFDVTIKKKTLTLSDRGASCKSAEERTAVELDDAWEVINDLAVNSLVELDNKWVLSKTIENFDESLEYLSMEVASFVQACILISNLVL